MATIAREGHYFTVLKKEAKNLGDYERVHFKRRSIRVVPQPNLQSQHSGSTQQISIAPGRPPRRPPRSQYVHFNKATAALFLRQTESLWLKTDLTRQAAMELLMDRPIGSFVVRGSQRAKYALSLRIHKDEVENTAVKHFLIQVNQQNFLTIQGSNLPFLSIYDLLAYFCFRQSGGMPCCLLPPNPAMDDTKQDLSESSDSDSDGESGEVEPAVPPAIPPRTASMGNMSPALKAAEDTPTTITTTTVKKRVAPPKPPRPAEGWGSEEEEEEGVEDNLVRRTNGMMAQGPEQGSIRPRIPPLPSTTVTTTTTPQQPPPSPPGVETHQEQDTLHPTVMRQRSNSESVLHPRQHHHHQQQQQQGSESSEMGRRRVRPKVSSLIEMFESKSPSSSPTRLRADRRGESGGNGSAFLPPSRDKETVVLRNEPQTHLTRFFSTGADGAPATPPKPKVVIPPVPPRPLSNSGGEEGGVPVVPPRTPAPLLPPKPPGSLPPSKSNHRRSRSNDTELFIPSAATPPPQLPPKLYPRYLPPGYEQMPSSRPAVEEDTPPTAPPVEGERGEKGEGREGGEGGREAGVVDEEGWVRLERPESGGGDEGPGVPGVPGTEESGLLGDNILMGEVDMNTKQGGWQIVTNATTNEQEGSGAGNKGAKWKPKSLGWAKKKLNFRPGKRKPRKRLRKFILDLSGDHSQEFGQKVADFITDMRARNTEPHQKMLLEIRNFITGMHEHLLKHHMVELNNCGMELCDNAGHVVECTLQECILQPLAHFVYLRIEEYYATNGHLFQVQRSIHQGRLKTTEEMGIRPHLLVPPEKVISEMSHLFDRMMKTSCAISKLEFLLEIVRLTYENIKDSRQPKKTLNDIGADDFLPIFVWVLVQCGFTRAEIEAEYMWGLAHPSLFNGEGGYYLTTLTSAVNVLKEITSAPQQAPAAQQLPTMNNLQTELKVFFEDEHTGQYSSAYYLPILPTMSAAEICEIIVEKRQIAEPQRYGLFTVEEGKATLLEDDMSPQEIKLKWTLQRTLEQSLGSSTKTHSPSNHFFAYKLRTPDS